MVFEEDEESLCDYSRKEEEVFLQSRVTRHYIVSELGFPDPSILLFLNLNFFFLLFLLLVVLVFEGDSGGYA